MQQNSQEWHEIKLGKITGTRFKSVMGGSRAKLTLINKLKEELLMIKNNDFDNIKKTINSAPIRHGKKHEQTAIEYISLILNLHEKDIERPAFISHNQHDFIGCSPDAIFRIAGKKTLVEVKCPSKLSSHEKYKSGNLKDHFDQIIGNTWVAGCEQGLFISFFHDIPNNETDIYYKYIDIDGEYVNKLEDQCVNIWRYVTGELNTNPLNTNSMAIPKLF